MRPIHVVTVIGMLTLAGAVAVGVAAQGPEPQAPDVALGTGFTYQGQLKKNNTPVNDSNCSMTFSLWDLPSNGVKSGVDQVISPVAVANGFFTVVLNGVNQFGASGFTGQDRWLQAAVKCAGDGSAVTLSRQRLTAAPYALFAAAPWQTSGSSLYYILGNVGIGTAAPNNKLTVSGAADIASYLRVGGNSGGAGIAGDIVARRTATSGAYYFGDSIDNFLYFDGNKYQFGQGGVYVTTGGQVLIGTQTGTEKLTVVTAAGDAVRGDASGGGGDGVTGFAASGNGVYGGSGGYGVYGTGGNAGVYGFSSSATGVVGFSSSGLGVYAGSTSGAWLIEGFDNGAGNDRFLVERATGNVKADGSFTSPADFAEMMSVRGQSADYTPGEVLVIGPDGKLTRSDKPYAVNLAGVYSARPGFLGDTEITAHGLAAATQPSTQERLAVALVGIVPVKVTAENGAIQPGDLLTTAATPGHAMKAKPVVVNGVEIYPTGAILGKALETWEHGQGTIQVLVTLR